MADYMFWIAVLAGVLAFWFSIMHFVKKRGWLSDNITVGTGYILWIKTKSVQVLDRIKQPESVYTGGSTIGLGLVYLIMVIGVIFVFGAAYASVVEPELPSPVNAPNNILLIPGVTDFVPLTVEVIIAMVLLITVHELAHGILARIHNITIKSAGIIWFIVPLGGFVEPDEDEVKAAPVMKRLQVYAAGITANLITLVISFFTTVYLLAQTTGVLLIKATVAETVAFYVKSFTLLFVLPIANVISPNAQTVWIMQDTVSWMPTHIEPFFGYWFLLHLSFWTFWISIALVFTNALPLKFTDGGQIFETTSKWVLEKVNLGQYAEPLSNNIALILLVFICGVFFIPYIYQMVG
jgi:membrane-associated protease RseP (regulator of RpoE activity)